MQPIHIFKAGTQTSSSGQTIVFTQADIEATAAAYDPALHEAPLVVGHPEEDDPAYGWIKQLAAQGGNLFATPHQVNADFEELVQAGSYKKVSASFYPPKHPNNPTPGVYALRHVGFLGAQPPAVKGLKPTQFADPLDAEPYVELEIDFAESQASDKASECTNFVDALHACSDVCACIDPIKFPPHPQNKEGAHLSKPINHKENPLKDDDKSKEPAKPAAPGTLTADEVAALQAQNATLQTQFAELQEQSKIAADALKAQSEAINTAKHESYAEGVIAAAKLPASLKPFLVATLNHLEPAIVPGTDAAQVSFASFGEGEAKQTLVDGFKAMLDALPAQVAFGEQASRARAAADGADQATVQYAEGTPQDQIDLDKRIRAYAVEHKLTYAEAASVVSTQAK